MTSQQAQAQIDAIDRRIAVVRWELHIRVPLIDTMSARSWQDAWDAHPQLRAETDELYRQRGELQLQRDNAAHKEWQAQQRRERAAHRASVRKSLLAERAQRAA